MPFIFVVLFVALLVLLASAAVPLWVARALWRYVNRDSSAPRSNGVVLRVAIGIFAIACTFASGWLSNVVFGRATFIAGTPTVNTAGGVMLPFFIATSIFGVLLLPIALVWREETNARVAPRVVAAIVVTGLVFLAGRLCLQEINRRRRQSLNIVPSSVAPPPMDVVTERKGHFASFGIEAEFQGRRLTSVRFRRGSAADLGLLRDASDARQIDLTACTIVEEDLAYLADTPHVEQLDLIATNLGDAGMRHLPSLRKLKILNVFANPRLSDAGLKPLLELSDLVELRVDGTAVTAAGATDLQIKMPRLRVIGVTGSIGKPSQEWTEGDWETARTILGEDAFQQALRDAALDGISTEAPAESEQGGRIEKAPNPDFHWEAFGFRTANQGGEPTILVTTRTGPADWSALREAPYLRALYSQGTPANDADLKNLRYTPHLRELSLSHTGISDQGLVQLTNVPDLELLDLRGNPAVTDKGLEDVRALSKLQSLRLEGTGVSANGVLRLEISCPDVQIVDVPGAFAHPRKQWTKRNWEAARSILGEEAFQQALRDAGLDGIPADAPEEDIIPEGETAPEKTSGENHPTEPAGTP